MNAFLGDAVIMGDLVDQGNANLTDEFLPGRTVSQERLPVKDDAVGLLSETILAALDERKPFIHAQGIAPVFRFVLHQEDDVIELSEHVLMQTVDSLGHERFELFERQIFHVFTLTAALSSIDDGEYNFSMSERMLGQRRPIPRTFIHVLINTAVANLTSNFIWFAVVFWVYLETRSILAVGILGGTYMFLVAACSMWFGSLVDRLRKHRVMVVSALGSLLAFALGGLILFTVPQEELLDLSDVWFWGFTSLILIGCVIELLRNLALSTVVTLLVPQEHHANANGLVGTVQGIAFIATSVLSGIAVGRLGMEGTMLLAMIATALPLVHLFMLDIEEPEIVKDPNRSPVDFRGGWMAMIAVPGLFALVCFTTLNNLSSGAFIALVDPYGLNMFTVEMWGVMFGLGSTGFIVGGLIVAKYGLGERPIRTMLLAVLALGVLGVLFTIREWEWLLIGGIWLFMALMPVIEAAEQTVIQRVVPFEKQGRVFGLAMTLEASAAPLVAFLTRSYRLISSSFAGTRAAPTSVSISDSSNSPGENDP